MSNFFWQSCRALLHSRTFWLWLSLMSASCGIVFLLYLDSYLDLQADIVKKSLRFGFSDLAVLPYLKIGALLATPIIAGMTANWYRRELHSEFSPLFLSLNLSPWRVVLAKTWLLTWLMLVLVAILFLPILVFATFSAVTLDGTRLVLTGMMIWATFTTIATFSAWLSCRFSGSVWGTFVTVAILGLTELTARLVTSPYEIAEFLHYLSPFYHVYHVANGTIPLSNVVFFLSSTTLCLLLTVVRLRHRYTYQ